MEGKGRGTQILNLVEPETTIRYEVVYTQKSVGLYYINLLLLKHSNKLKVNSISHCLDAALNVGIFWN